jgi:hypothetical protein
VHLALARMHEAAGRPADAKASLERFLAVAPSSWTADVAAARERLASLAGAP